MERTIKLPYMLDFIPRETEDDTRIHRFYEALREGRLTTTKCASCGRLLWQPRVACPHCNSDEMEWVDLPSEGTVYAHTAMVLGAPLGLEDQVPFVIAIVELDLGGDEKLRLFTRVDDAKHEDMKIGQRLYLKVVDCGDGRVIYRFSRLRQDPGRD